MKIKLFVKYISLLVLLFVADGCKEKKADTYVTKVTDLTGEEEQVLKLEYDRDGKIIKYGDTPVRYEGDQITIGQMDCLNTGNKLCNVTFQIGKGKARESRARCMLKVGEEVYEADKQTVYDYKGDTIFINSDYRATSDYRFLKKVQGKYVFDQLGRLKEVMTVFTEANDSVSSCHTYYNYDNNTLIKDYHKQPIEKDANVFAKKYCKELGIKFEQSITNGYNICGTSSKLKEPK